jgi:hypothetical protein
LTGLAAATIATIATGAALGIAAARLARRVGGARAWNLVAVAALGGVIAGSGLLVRLLRTGGAPGSLVAANTAVAAGGAVVAVALVFLTREARR